MSFGKRKTPKHLILEDYHYTKPKNSIAWILLAVFVLFASMVFSLYANASTNTSANTSTNATISEATTGQILFQNTQGDYQPALHVSSKAEVDINGLVAHVSLTQSFSNQTEQWQEGIYIFPLPENAAVNHMEMNIGERVIIGEIKEKLAARKIYQKAKQAGKRAALTEQKRPNLFTQRVANIAPNQTIEIRIHYVHPTTYNNGTFSWRIPTTITPRYVPTNVDKTTQESEIESNIAVVKQPEKNTIDISPTNGWSTTSVNNNALPESINRFTGKNIYNPITINVTLNSGLPLAQIASPYHDINISKHEQHHTIALSNGEVNMDRDFELTWQPVASAAPQAALFSEEVDGDFYSLLMVLPPQNLASAQRLARDMIFIIDTSGSMAGTSMNQAKESLIQGLDKLGPRDRFNIIEFDSHYSTLFSRLSYADNTNIQQAKRWIQGLHPDGGTEMQAALNAALNQFEQTNTLQQTIFITDGAVSNEAELFRTIRNKLGNSRLFTVAIGSAPNSYFMKKAAKFGRGTFTHIGKIQQVTEKIDDLFHKLDRAIAKNIRISWPGNANIYPQKIPDLYDSEPLVISAHSNDLKGEIVIEGETALSPWRQYINLEQNRSGKSISSVWARAKIEDLEDLNISGGNSHVLTQEIITTALRHKLLTKYTSFVAVEKEISRPNTSNLKSNPLHNATPAGHKSVNTRKVNYPNTATHYEISWWLGLFFLMIAIVIHRLKD